MRKKSLILFFLTTPFFVNAQNEWPLQRWTEVRGTVNGQKLGTFVAGVPPNPNLPYKAAVSKSGSTSFFRLQSATDTSAQLTLTGENPLFGDLNSDGWLDVVTVKSTSGYDTVYIFWGSVAGLDITSPLVFPNENRFDELRPGYVGDVDNDGKKDLILTAGSFPGLFDGVSYGNGKVYFFLNPINNNRPNGVIVGDSILSGLGKAVAVGDLNHDGLYDLIVRGRHEAGSQDEFYDYINIYWGRSEGRISLNLGKRLRSTGFSGKRGLGCFDVNGDGVEDLLWTTREANSLQNEVFIHLGGTLLADFPNLRLENPGVANFGQVIINGRDMNGDGHNDIVVTADAATITSGFVFAFSGGKSLDSKFDGAVGFSTDARFGWSVASLGDVNSDGLTDIIVGAPEYDFGTNKGFWGVFLGDRNIPNTIRGAVLSISKSTLFQSFPNPFNEHAQISFFLLKSGRIQLVIFDSLGREICRLIDQFLDHGVHKAIWNGTDGGGRKVGSGVYYYQLRTTQGEVLSQKMILLN